MPDKTYNIIDLKLKGKLKTQYKELEKEFYLQIEEVGVEALNAAAKSGKLRQLLQGALYTEDDYIVVHQQKIDALSEIVEYSEGSPILVAIQFKFEVDLIKARFGNVPIINGATKTKDRKKYIDQWNRKELPMLVCHPKSLSHGVNLQGGGHTLVYLGLPWSLEQYDQLIGRLYRQGQKNNVVIHHIVFKNSIDSNVVNALRNKENVQESILKSYRGGIE
jgi:SNF2 family DNA or RNA helicase